MKKQEPEIIKQAKKVLSCIEGPTLPLAKELKKQKYFAYARKVYKKLEVSEELSKEKRLQELAICTYKDPDLPGDFKFDKAFAYLNKIEDINQSEDQERLGLAGAIFKRKWQFNGKLKNLDYSLYYYYRGYELWGKDGVDDDDGYTAINAAYIIDLLAHQEIKEREKLGIPIDVSEQLKKAQDIRQKIIDHFAENGLPSDRDWVIETLAEAHFGLQQFDQAEKYLKQIKTNPKGWEFETTARQLASIAQIQMDFESNEMDRKELERKAKKALNAMVEIDGVDSAFTGKIGLALSGGGFRASLYHIGVLARLAELGVLKHVETISCVSGGSILGVYYYLLVKQLLEKKSDKALDNSDYIKIVKRLEADFVTKIQCNIRMKVFESLPANLRFFSGDGYTRTHRLGELYEEILYQDLFENKTVNTPLFMSDLIINPIDEGNSFNIKKDNWRRKHKVPKLILNATTLNTGHNWQFTATFMGEPPGNIVSEVDAKYRLRRMYYYEAPEEYQAIRLGHAVAASSGVPGVFNPLALSGLYPDIDLQLVDGGVHDNQGVMGLLEQECSILFVSDASGQLATQESESGHLLKVLTRTNDILMERVREGGFQDLNGRKDAGLVKDLLFVHLTKELESKDKDWITVAVNKCPKEKESLLTSYGIAKKQQKLLSTIRTDLDAFNYQEAYALMYSGYQMASSEYSKSIKNVIGTEKKDPDWKFLKIAPQLRDTSESTNIIKLLEASGQRMFKVFALNNTYRIGLFIFCGILLSLTLWLIYKFADFLSHIEISFIINIFDYLPQIGFAILTFVVAKLFGDKIADLIGRIKSEGEIQRKFIGLGMALFLFLMAKIYLKFFNSRYLKDGEI